VSDMIVPSIGGSGFDRLYTSVPDAVRRAFKILSAPLALTDQLAETLLSGLAGERFRSQEMVAVIRNADFIIDRNSEWHIRKDVRRTLLEKLEKDEALCCKAHKTLLVIAAMADASEAGDTVPTYLTTPLGIAYHSLASGQRDADVLAGVFSTADSGVQWLISEIAEEQRSFGRIPRESVLPAFFAGMTAYREGRSKDAIHFFEIVARSDLEEKEVAIALHILGVILARNFQERNRAEALLLRSLKIGEQIGHLHHQTQVLHSLGNLIGGKSPKEAEDFLLRSLKIEEQIGDRHGEAMVLNSLGNLIGGKSPKEAKDFLRRSLKILEKIGDRHGEAQVLHSLGNLIGGKSPKEAKDFLLRSLKIKEQIGDRHGEAQVLHSLGNLISESDPEEAERFLRRSLKIGEQIGHLHHQAQVLNSLGNLTLRYLHDAQSASAWYDSTIKVSKHPRDLAVAYLGLSRVAESEGNLPAAVDHMRQAIAHQERSDAPQYVGRHRRRLARLEVLLKGG